MKKSIESKVYACQTWAATHPTTAFWAQSLGISWLYAIAEQIAIPVLFTPVPIIAQQILLFLAPSLWGTKAVTGYMLFLLQGAAGAPVFIYGKGGLVHLLGPTGGYLIGMGVATVWLCWREKTQPQSSFSNILNLYGANLVIFACGLAYLSFFIPSTKLLLAGLWPFLIGDFIIKPAIVLSIRSLFYHFSADNKRD